MLDPLHLAIQSHLISVFAGKSGEPWVKILFYLVLQVFPVSRTSAPWSPRRQCVNIASPHSPKLTFPVNFCSGQSNLKGLTFVLFCEEKYLLSYSVLPARRDDFPRPGTWGNEIGSQKIRYFGSVRVMDRFNWVTIRSFLLFLLQRNCFTMLC